jgi:sporulation protein YlmC with PRC-barrel domain
MRLEFGKGVRLTDDASRELADVVVDARTGSVTHLVVQPHDDPDGARLVPIDLAAGDGDGEDISLDCTTRALDEMERVHEHRVVRAGQAADQDSNWDIGVEDVQPIPEYAPTAFGEYGGAFGQDVAITYDRVPKGEIELRHASAVYSSDSHHMGSVEGVVVDSGDRITHLLLERGHLWWRRELAVPAAAVSKFEQDMVVLGVTKSELGEVVAKDD